MKVAIPVEDNRVSEHFGHSKGFLVFQCEDGKILQKEQYENLKETYGSVPNFLKEIGVQQVIAGSMGRNVYNKLTDFGIQSIIGATGEVEKVIEQYLLGSLESDESKIHENTPGHGHH